MKVNSAKTLPRLDESLLSHLPPFAQLSRGQIRDILDQAHVKQLSNGATLFDEGEPATHFYLLLDGYVRVVRITPEGEQVIALHIPPGQFCGIAKALGRDTYPASAVIADEGLVLSWPTELWDNFIAQYPGFGTEAYKTVGKRVGELNNRIMEMATQQVERRIANTLLRLVNQTGKKVDIGIEIDFPITRQDLSEMSGTTLHTVSRVLSGWEKREIIKSARKKITVLRAHDLVVLTGS